MRIIYLLSMILLLTLLFAGSGQAEPNIEGTTVQYSAKGVVMKGYFAYDKNIKGQRPGVLVVHEWWGLNDFPRKPCRCGSR